MEAKPAFVRVVASDALDVGESKCFDVSGVRILLCRAQAGYFAIGPNCSHVNQPLEGGKIRGSTISCPHHGARFDLTSGRPLGNAGLRNIPAFPCREKEGWVEVMLLS